MPERILDWEQIGSNGSFLTPGTTFDTGGVQVTVGFEAQDDDAFARLFEWDQYVAPGEPFDSKAALKLGGDTDKGESDTSVTTLDFSSTDSEFGDEVSDVSFRINDLDLGQHKSNYEDIVTVRAYNAEGEEVPVTLTPGEDISVSDDTATGGDDNAYVTPATEPGNSLLVEIDGPVSSIEVDLDNGGEGDQAVFMTDVHFKTTPGPVPPCFTPGTMIATPRGERRVEDLKVGDRVITRDNGLQEIRWIGTRTLGADELKRRAHLQPVLIRTGALGHGLPERDLLVSPQHRVLINNERTALYFEDREVLASARHLTDMDGVDVVESSEVTYIHIMFDQHEVVLSNGAWSESFQPGDQVLDGMATSQRDELYELFPELREPEGVEAYQAARRSLKRHEARLLVK